MKYCHLTEPYYTKLTLSRSLQGRHAALLPLQQTEWSVALQDAGSRSSLAREERAVGLLPGTRLHLPTPHQAPTDGRRARWVVNGQWSAVSRQCLCRISDV